MTIKTGCPVCDEPTGIRGQVVYLSHCQQCHTYPCDECGSCRCHGAHHHTCTKG
jgi:hypothetical protein